MALFGQVDVEADAPYVSTAASTTIVVPRSMSVLAGDVLVFHLAHNSSTAATFPVVGGLDRVRDSFGSARSRTATYLRTVTDPATEPTSWTFNVVQSGHSVGQVVRLRNADPILDLGVGSSGSTLSLIVPSVSTNADAACVLLLSAFERDATASTPGFTTVISSATGAAVIASDRVRATVFAKSQAITGESGDATVTMSGATARNQNGVQIAVIPGANPALPVPGNVVATAQSPTSILVDWDAVTPQSGFTIVYDLERYEEVLNNGVPTGQRQTTPSLTTTVTASQYLDNTLPSLPRSARYFHRVRAREVAG